MSKKADNRLYNAERKAQADLIKRDLDRDKLITQLYQESYDRLQAQIDKFYLGYAGREGLTKQEAMKRASEFDVTKFAERAIKAVKEKDFSHKTNAWLRVYNLKMKVSRLELLKAELDLEINSLTSGLDEVFDKARRSEYLAEYKRQAGILGISSSGATKRLKTILDADFYGQSFSSRVWGKNGLQSMLQKDVFASLNRIYTDMNGYQKEMKLLANKYGTSEYNAKRLIKTEIARINADTDHAVLKDNGFTHMIFVAEPGACDICGPLDKKAIPIDEVEKGVNMFPMHPNCRCSAYGHIKMNYKAGGSTLDEYELWDTTIETDDEKVYNQGIDRNKDPNKRRPVNITKQKELLRNFKESGGFVWQDNKATEYLKTRGVDACCLGHDLIVLQKRPLISEILEELFHAKQFKNGLVIDSEESRILAEIEAQEYLISVAEEFNIPKSEQLQTKKALENYKSKLKELEKHEK